MLHYADNTAVCAAHNGSPSHIKRPSQMCRRRLQKCYMYRAIIQKISNSTYLGKSIRQRGGHFQTRDERQVDIVAISIGVSLSE